MSAILASCCGGIGGDDYAHKYVEDCTNRWSRGCRVAIGSVGVLV